MGGEIFRTSPDRPRGPPSLLYDGYRAFFPEVKRPGRGVDHPPHPAPRLKEEYSYTSTPPLLVGLLQGKLYLYLYRDSFLWLKRPICDVNHPPPSRAEVKNEWSHTSTPPIRVHGKDSLN